MFGMDLMHKHLKLKSISHLIHYKNVESIIVKDDGYGIDRSLLNNKFKPFFQSEKVYDPDIKHSTTHGKNGVWTSYIFHFFQRLQNGIPFMSMITKSFHILSRLIQIP